MLPFGELGDAMQIDKRKQNKTQRSKVSGGGLGGKKPARSQQPAASSQ